MALNPFETPNAASLTSRPPPGTPGKIELGQCFSDAWRALKSNVGVWVVATLVGGVLAMLATGTVIGIVLVLPVLYAGFCTLQLKMQDGEEAELSDIFSGFSRYGAILLPMLLAGAAVIGLEVLGSSLTIAGDVAGIEVLSAVGRLVGFLVGIFVIARLTFAPYYIVDQGMSGMEALSASWSATATQIKPVALLALVSGIVAVSGMIVLFVGIFVTMWLSSLMWTSAYRQLAGR